MPEQVSRFRRDDKQTCQAREYGSLDNLAAHVEYVLAGAAEIQTLRQAGGPAEARRSLPGATRRPQRLGPRSLAERRPQHQLP